MLRNSRKSALSLFSKISNSTVSSNSTKTQQRNRYDVNINLRFCVNDEATVVEKLKAAGAIPLSENKTVEVYFERMPSAKVALSDAFVYGKVDTWLCKKNDEFRVLAPAKEEQTDYQHAHRPIESGRLCYYQEHIGERAIRRQLQLQLDATKPNNKTFEEDLISRNIVPFATITTKQQLFDVPDAKEKLSADLKITDFGYTVGTVNVKVPNAKVHALEQAYNRLKLLALDLGVKKVYAPEIIIEYIYRNYRADFFKALVDAKIVVDHSKQ